MSSIYEIGVETVDRQPSSLAPYRGNAMLIVNVASQCGFTPQYALLESLYRTYREQGLIVLGFPCNQFGNQEPGDEAEIKSFCSREYEVTFPLFAKIEVNGAHAHPLFELLKSAKRGFLFTRAIKWNFTKFLVDRAGNVVKRYAPTASFTNIEADVRKVLKSK